MVCTCICPTCKREERRGWYSLRTRSPVDDSLVMPFFGVTGNDCPIPAPVSHETQLHFFFSLQLHVWLFVCLFSHHSCLSSSFSLSLSLKIKAATGAATLFTVPDWPPTGIMRYRNHDAGGESKLEAWDVTWTSVTHTVLQELLVIPIRSTIGCYTLPDLLQLLCNMIAR